MRRERERAINHARRVLTMFWLVAQISRTVRAPVFAHDSYCTLGAIFFGVLSSLYNVCLATRSLAWCVFEYA